MIVCTREYCATPFFRYYDHRVLLLGFLLFCPFCVPFLSPLVPPPVPIVPGLSQGQPRDTRFSAFCPGFVLFVPNNLWLYGTKEGDKTLGFDLVIKTH